MNILWVLFAIAAIVGLYFYQKDSKKISAVFKRQALQRTGSIKNVFASYPQLSFRHRDVDIFVSAGDGENGSFTYARFYTTVFPNYCSFRITSRSRLTIVMETRRELKKVKIDRAEFDNKFIIRAKEEEFIRSLLTPEIQIKLLELGKRHGLEVRFLNDKLSKTEDSVEKFRFDIIVEHLLIEDQDYERLIEATIMLYEQMKKLTIELNGEN